MEPNVRFQFGFLPFVCISSTLAAIAPHSDAISARRRRAARRLMGPSNWSLMLPFISLVSTRLGSVCLFFLFLLLLQTSSISLLFIYAFLNNAPEKKKIRRGLWTFIPIELIYCQIIYVVIFFWFQFVPTTLAIFYCLFISGPQTNRYELFVSFLFVLLDKSKQNKDSSKFFPVSFCALAMLIVGVYAIFHKFLFVPELCSWVARVHFAEQ